MISGVLVLAFQIASKCRRGWQIKIPEAALPDLRRWKWCGMVIWPSPKACFADFRRTEPAALSKVVMRGNKVLHNPVGSCLRDFVLARINYFGGGAVQIAPGAPSLIHSVTPAELESIRSGQTRCASCRFERGRSVPRGIRRRYARGRILVRPPQLGRGAGLGARNGRTRQRVVLFERTKSCWTWEKT
jgi:hypothetical protein